MRKINFLTTVLGVAAAMLMGVNAYGQAYPPSPYVVFNTDKTNGATHDDEVDYVTIGGSQTYYVLPDPVYHPMYTTDGTITSNSTWTWSIPAAIPAANYTATNNQVTITFPSTAAANYSINVTENASSAMGGCTGNPTYLYVSAIAAPTATLSIVPSTLTAPAPATWQQIGATAGLSYQICSSQAAQTVTMNFVENVPIDYASYSFQITEEIDMIDASGTVQTFTGADGTETVITNGNFRQGAGNQLNNDTYDNITGATFTETSAGHFTFTFPTAALSVLNDVATTKSYRTRYTYRVRTADNTAPTYTDVSATNTFVSNILVKSGLTDGITFTNNTVSFIVNPAPVTGPIYHLSNTYSF